jgi:hypothetical protein
MRGVFYNSKESVCSIWETGQMCYNALKNSDLYTLDYSEDTSLNHSYDFAIFNQHPTVNNWMNKHIIRTFNKPTFCIVTEVHLSSPNPIAASPNYFSHYIVLDPTITESNTIHAFGRPIEQYTPVVQEDTDSIVKIFSFGFATQGKDWHTIIEQVHAEFDQAEIHFNIPKATYVTDKTYANEINKIIVASNRILKKPGVTLKLTADMLSKKELIDLCAKQTINCFFYSRTNKYNLTGLAAVTDQAISAGRPILVSGDPTFRHIHKYIGHYPNISIKEAIKTSLDGVLEMRQAWSADNFRKRFDSIITTYNMCS